MLIFVFIYDDIRARVLVCNLAGVKAGFEVYLRFVGRI